MAVAGLLGGQDYSYQRDEMELQLYDEPCKPAGSAVSAGYFEGSLPQKYKKLDGLILDRMRFDNITSDFSPLSKQLFEEYSGIKLRTFRMIFSTGLKRMTERWSTKPGSYSKSGLSGERW
jgi:hypothetical protein